MSTNLELIEVLPDRESIRIILAKGGRTIIEKRLRPKRVAREMLAVLEAYAEGAI